MNFDQTLFLFNEKMLPFKSVANENENPNLSNIATNLTEKFSYSIKCKFNLDKKNEFPYY